VLARLKGHLPPKPKEAGNLLTVLEAEEDAKQEADFEDDPKF
jgi:hypothetical protein